ncbi:MAG: hypothetical protein JNJ40_18345 [Bacteroidia bacterium]|nr:hypothetical protein [Bacteroidia bacterium]
MYIRIFKNRFTIILGLSLFILQSCQKQNDGYGSILAHAQCRNNALDQPMIYIKEDSQASTSSFDYKQSGDAIGEAYFTNLKPGTYYVYARGYDPVNKLYVSGSKSIVVAHRERQNEYKVVVDAN